MRSEWRQILLIHGGHSVDEKKTVDNLPVARQVHLRLDAVVFRSRTYVEQDWQPNGSCKSRMRTFLRNSERRRQLADEIPATRAVRVEVDVIGQCFLNADRWLNAERIGLSRCCKHKQTSASGSAHVSKCAGRKHIAHGAGTGRENANACPRTRNSHSRSRHRSESPC